MKKPEFPDISIFVCEGSKCSRHKSFKKKLKTDIKENFRNSEVEIFAIDCTDRCKHAPIATVQPLNTWFYECDESTPEAIVKEIKKAGV